MFQTYINLALKEYIDMFMLVYLGNILIFSKKRPYLIYTISIKKTTKILLICKIIKVRFQCQKDQVFYFYNKQTKHSNRSFKIEYNCHLINT